MGLAHTKPFGIHYLFFFSISLAQTYSVLELLTAPKALFNSSEELLFKGPFSVAKILWFKVICIVILLTLNFFADTPVYRLFLLLVGSVLVATISLFWRAQLPDIQANFNITNAVKLGNNAI